jgi:hypothetical protein
MSPWNYKLFSPATKGKERTGVAYYVCLLVLCRGLSPVGEQGIQHQYVDQLLLSALFHKYPRTSVKKLPYCIRVFKLSSFHFKTPIVRKFMALRNESLISCVAVWKQRHLNQWYAKRRH